MDEDWVGKAAALLAGQLQRCEPGSANPLPAIQRDLAIMDAAQLLGYIAEMMGQGEALAEATGIPFEPTLRLHVPKQGEGGRLKRRSSGKPAGVGLATPTTTLAAVEFERLVKAGVPQKEAIFVARKKYGVGRSKLLAEVKRIRDFGAWRRALPNRQSTDPPNQG